MKTLRRLSSSKKPGGDESEMLSVTLNRVNGTLGLTLTLGSTRVTSVEAKSVAEEGGVELFDKITAVNGEPLTGKLGDALATVQGTTIELTIERPPKSEHAKILADEEARASRAIQQATGEAPKVMGIRKLSLGGRKSSDATSTGEEDPLSALGIEQYTISLLRIKDDPLTGLEMGHINEVLAVAVDSAAHKAGLRVGDTVVRLNGKALFPDQTSVIDFLPLEDEVGKLEPDVDIVLSVRRGRAFADSVSYTPRLSSAEL